MDLETFRLLTDDNTRKTFKYIVDKKSVQYRVLKDLKIENLSNNIKILQDNGLIKVIESSILQFSVHYITAKGLVTDRELKRVLSSYK